MIPVHVALVATTSRVSPAELALCAGALNEQIQSDFAPAWHVAATVGRYPVDAVPAGCWRIEIDDKMDEPGALGYHSDANRQPYAKVLLTPDWTVTVSHELLEMLADPFGSRLHQARLPHGVSHEAVGYDRDSQRVHYLLEVCDPPERTSYEIGGVAVSDFVLPSWYRTNPPAGQRAFSHAAGCLTEREVADGGYVSFATADGVWWQVFNRGGSLDVHSLGRFDGSTGSLREWTDSHARLARAW